MGDRFRFQSAFGWWIFLGKINQLVKDNGKICFKALLWWIVFTEE